MLLLPLPLWPAVATITHPQLSICVALRLLCRPQYDRATGFVSEDNSGRANIFPTKVRQCDDAQSWRGCTGFVQYGMDCNIIRNNCLWAHVLGNCDLNVLYGGAAAGCSHKPTCQAAGLTKLHARALAVHRVSTTGWPASSLYSACRGIVMGRPAANSTRQSRQLAGALAGAPPAAARKAAYGEFRYRYIRQQLTLAAFKLGAAAETCHCSRRAGRTGHSLSTQAEDSAGQAAGGGSKAADCAAGLLVPC